METTAAGAPATETTTYPSELVYDRPAEPIYDRGRIRLTEKEACELIRTVSLEIETALETRSELVDAGVDGAAPHMNRRVTHLRRVLSELERTAGDKGWNAALETIDYYREATA